MERLRLPRGSTRRDATHVYNRSDELAKREWLTGRSRAVARGASTGATGNGLEDNTRAEQPKQTYVGTKGTGANLPLFTVGDGCQVLTPQRDALDTCPSTVPAA